MLDYQQIDFKGKTVLIREDFNVPMRDGVEAGARTVSGESTQHALTCTWCLESGRAVVGRQWLTAKAHERRSAHVTAVCRMSGGPAYSSTVYSLV